LRDNKKVNGIIRSVSASISIIGSAAIIWHILPSHKGLLSTYHRLLSGLCIGDLITSFAYVFNSTAPAPKEVQCLMPFARGNMGTCTAQGFFLTVGILIASIYNCNICVYYLSILTFKKKDDYIKRKLEPWFHGVPIISAIMTGITGLIVKQFNNDGLVGNCCLSSYHLPHCRGVANGIIPEGFTVPVSHAINNRTNYHFWHHGHYVQNRTKD